MKNFRLESVILAIGLLLLGICIKGGFDSFAERDRSVNVKGLAEEEALYDEIKRSNQTIVQFLKEKGISETEISINAPEIIDLKADRYSNQENTAYRYNVTSVITVTSNKVDLIRDLVTEQGELLKRGIAVTGGDYRYNIQYEYTGLNTIKPKMIEEATKNAREAAEKFAKDSDSKLGKIRHAYQGQFSISDRDANTPYIKKVRVVTTIDYSLED